MRHYMKDKIRLYYIKLCIFTEKYNVVYNRPTMIAGKHDV